MSKHGKHGPVKRIQAAIKAATRPIKQRPAASGNVNQNKQLRKLNKRPR